MSKVPDVIHSTMAKAREMVDANTVVGSPISVADGITLVPISKISIGVGGGGADLNTKNASPDGNFGGGAGCGVNVTPVAMVVIHGETVRLLPIDAPARTAAERAVEQLPGLVDKLCELVRPQGNDVSEN